MPPADVRLRPSSNLLCYLEGEAWPEVIVKLAREQEGLASSHTWVLEPPDFVNESADGDATVGVVLRLISSVDSSGKPSDRDADRASLADVEAVIAWAEQLSAEEGLDFGFELDGNSVGWVEGGHADRQLIEGLVEPWRGRL